ncbi:RAMP superfamily CRISPR-associated protein [Salinivibrio sp. HTSP]|uniref:RAMP superfamily CRISPR-associated protein n=1 Tax=Salinivibrio sp. HTSP TaxID=2115977 RepID=UPI000E314A02|nr:RAMP superfamily CRISPR-associated protein [Salinivibrio sp. HTSP]
MSHIYVTKLILETQSPMAINSGHREEGFDTQLAREVNGLPYIPASAIAGVWRHLAHQRLADDGLPLASWFGTTEGASRLTISHGIVHDSQNRPVSPLMPAQDIANDPILSRLALARPHHRERVAVNDRGAAKETGKFDQILLPKGVRFSVTLQWHSDEMSEHEQQQWQALLALWADRHFTLGASSRNGLGQIKVIACEQTSFDLMQGPSAGQALQQFLHSENTSTQPLTPADDRHQRRLASLPLQAVDNWRCGSGTTRLGDHDIGNDIGIKTYSEPEIHWQANDGAFSEPRPILCGSSIKGILAHRLAYHLRRHQADWAEDRDTMTHAEWQVRPDALSSLFGAATSSQGEGIAGHLFIDDADVTDYRTTVRTHNRIDRFTGGVQQGGLFSEELLYQPKFTLNIWVSQNTRLSSTLQAALADTIEDLRQGLLPMGAGSGRGTSLVMPQTGAEWIVNWSALETENLETERAQ